MFLSGRLLSFLYMFCLETTYLNWKNMQGERNLLVLLMASLASVLVTSASKYGYGICFINNDNNNK